jgi:hypothetical protein
MSATAIVVSFMMGTSEAAFCTQPAPIEQAQEHLSKIDMRTWLRAHPGLTVPSIIVRGHPNYTDALAGKIVDDPVTGASHSVPPCAPFPKN